jgi:hypothetical protein
MHIDSPRLPLHLTFRIVYDLLLPSQRVSDRGRDEAYSSRVRGTSSGPAIGQSRFGTGMYRVLEPDTLHALDDSFSRIIWVARSLYRCHLSCKDAFPSQNLKEQWTAAVWKEACERTGASPGSPPAAVTAEARSVPYRIVHDLT